MQTSKPTNLIITDCNGKTIIGQCLPTIARQTFLELWRDAWGIMSDSLLANAAASSGDKWKAIAHLFDNNPDFKFLCRSMLQMFNLNIDRLDIGQVTELLFFSEGGQGLLVDLQFPPMPPGGTAPKEDDWIDPAARMLGLMAYRSGNWQEAYEALKNIPYDQLVQAFEAQKQAHGEETRKAKNPGRVSPPPLRSSQPSTHLSAEDPRIELVRQQAQRMRVHGAETTASDELKKAALAAAIHGQKTVKANPQSDEVASIETTKIDKIDHSDTSSSDFERISRDATMNAIQTIASID